MKQIELTIRNRTGLHARPAKVLVALAKEFKADVRISCNQKRVNGKSMVSLLTLGATCGSSIFIEATGEDEELAISRIEEAVRSGLGDQDLPESDAAPVVPAIVTNFEAVPRRPEVEPANSIRGIGAAPGIAVGPLFQYRNTELSPDDLNPPPGSTQVTLNEALAQARQQLTRLYEEMVRKHLAAEAAIFEAQCEFLSDLDLLEGVQARVAQGQSIARAWQTTVDERAEAIANLGDAILAARADDLRDVGRRVLSLLLGIADSSQCLPSTPVVISARDLSPSTMATFDPGAVLGFVIVNGGPTSHVAILARALGLPAVVSVPESVLSLPGQTTVILNGCDGTLIVDPESKLIDRCMYDQSRWLEDRQRAQEGAALPAATLDGRQVSVTANIGSIADAVQALKMGADGIGLLRTEFLFLDRNAPPEEDEQFSVYCAIAETMNSLPVIVRTMDIGGDKPLAYIHMNPEANPFLGIRGIRLCLNDPRLFCAQLRAILRAAPHGNLQIMFPMVSDIGELRRARMLVEEQRERLNAPAVKVGIMIEVPSAALLADKLASEADFFSIGTNDLTQYTLAMDRGHPGLAANQDGLHPAVLRLIAQTVEAAHKHGKRVELCGELGSDPAAIPILIGMGIDELSVSIPAIPTVKAQVRTLLVSESQPLARQALECSSAAEVRTLVSTLSGGGTHKFRTTEAF